MPKACYWVLICFGGLAMLSCAARSNADARLAIIIDDIGYNKSQSERAARLDGRFTLSVLPFTPYGVASAHLAHSQGKELMLHLPMSTINNMPMGKGGLVSGMEKTAFLAVVRQDLADIPYIRGINNHMGSRLTQETEPMHWLMEELRPRGLYFVDSRTSAQTRALDIANLYQVSSLKRDVFLDDLKETKAIEYQLKRAIQFARQRGMAVAIGHPYPATLSVLENIQPLLKEEGVRLVYVSQLLKPAPKPEIEVEPQPIPVPSIPSQHIPNFIPDELFYCPVTRFDLLHELRTEVDLYTKTAIMKRSIFGY